MIHTFSTSDFFQYELYVAEVYEMLQIYLCNIFELYFLKILIINSAITVAHMQND